MSTPIRATVIINSTNVKPRRRIEQDVVDSQASWAETNRPEGTAEPPPQADDFPQWVLLKDALP